MAWSKQQQRAEAAAKTVYEATEEFDMEEDFIEAAYEDAILEPIRTREELEPYYDDLALVKCWKSALIDFKYSHPSKFGPLQEAPRSYQKKLESAPLWYEPIASGSNKTLDDSANAQKRKNPPTKKQKSGKKVKLDLPVSSPTSAPPSPNLSPPEPTAMLAPPLPLPSILPTPVNLPPSQLLPPFPPAVAALLPRVYPAPPVIEDVEPGANGDLLEGGEEELLQNALWAWYNSGYQTGLYHAAMSRIGRNEE